MENLFDGIMAENFQTQRGKLTYRGTGNTESFFLLFFFFREFQIRLRQRNPQQSYHN